jgi:hypothetical protein
MSDFDDLMSAGFGEAKGVLGPSGSSTPSQISFNGVTADCVTSSLTSGRTMLPAGYQLDYDQDCIITKDDFDRLAMTNEDEPTIDGQVLRLHKWEFDGPLVTLFLKAVR